MKRVVLFDFDGTIADSFHNFLKIVEALSKKHNLPRLTRDQIEQLRSEDARSILKKLNIPFYKIPLLARDMKAFQAKSLSEIHPFTGIPEVLGDLKANGYKLGIITSNGHENVQNFLQNHKIDIFEYIHSDSSLFGKDRMIAKFLAQNEIGKDDVIYVGDEMRDIEACKKVDIKIIAVTWGFNSREGLAKLNPDYLIDEPSELSVILHTKV